MSILCESSVSVFAFQDCPGRSWIILGRSLPVVEEILDREVRLDEVRFWERERSFGLAVQFMAFLFSSILSVCSHALYYMTDRQSASQAAPLNSSAPAVGSDTVSQFAMLVAQMMSKTQNRASTVSFEYVDRHLQMFLRLKPPRFEGTVEPRATEDWLRRLEKTFDGMQCPPDRKVPLAVFLLDGEAERWWMGQQEEKFQGKLNSLITWEEFSEGSRTVMQYEAEFTALARYAPQLVNTSAEKCYRFLRGLRDSLRHPLWWTASRKRFDSDVSGSGFSGKKKFVSGDPKRSGQSGSTTVFGSGSTTSSGSVSGAPVCQTCGRRHFGQYYRATGQCFRCGQPGHRITECPQAGFDRRSESRSDSFVRLA
ncbi:uncharacterized protein LOC114579208 [Dendrobium catenatum]|uniref:uncharacterized protein LOC114579208 n=1 Tax=Dendrobium catenatum TaxID=906689 RepID=UPI0010A054C4|nr:uncharacterized protein LOC114579208 [Dendrobium catenatum]